MEFIELEKLVGQMRRLGVKHLRHGDLELTLESQEDEVHTLSVDDLRDALVASYDAPESGDVYEQPDLYPDGIVPRLGDDEGDN